MAYYTVGTYEFDNANTMLTNGDLWQTWQGTYATNTTVTFNNDVWYGWQGGYYQQQASQQQAMNQPFGQGIQQANQRNQQFIYGQAGLQNAFGQGLQGQALGGGRIGAIPPPNTAEVEARLQNYAAQIEADRAKRLVVESRAASLLRAVLDAAEYAKIMADGHFDLTVEGGTAAPRIYRIQRSTHGNIQRIDAAGKVLEQWCVQPTGIPTDDVIAAQVLALRHDEAGIRARANVTRVAA